MDVFSIKSPTASRVPIVLSIPHSGTQFPSEIKDQFNPGLSLAPDDTDWFVDKLYDFAPAMGITTISANLSRWVIDLNRNPEGKPLYSDGRIITAICPTTDFLGNPLYNDHRKEVEPVEIERRKELYFWPYYQQLQKQLNELKRDFDKVLLWDCHSIRQVVKTIQEEKFPDLILGDADATSASPGLIETALSIFEHSTYSITHNHPFKGGNITRSFGKPIENQHALQLEMTKVMYMDDSETQFDEIRAAKMRTVLMKVFEALIVFCCWVVIILEYL
jgi:N-formylglutamate deformylase